MRSPEQKFDFLDYLRGIAILAVFLFHCLSDGFGYFEPPWNHWLRDLNMPRSYLLVMPFALGWAGVAIFFAISGFCIHLSFARSASQSFVEFYIRRFFRIFPPYLLALITFVLIVPVNHEHIPTVSFWWQCVSHFFLIHNFDTQTFYGINSSFWSLAVEVQLYLIYPVLVLMVRRFGWTAALVLLGVLELSCRTAMAFHFVQTGEMPKLLSGFPIAYWFSWSIGAAVADAYLSNKPLPLAKSPLWLWAFLACGSWFVKPLAAYSFMLFAILTAATIAHLLSGGGFSAWRFPRLPRICAEHLRMTGVLSYSLYLWHEPCLRLVSMFLRNHLPASLDIDILRFFACCSTWLILFPLCILLYRYCEIPATDVGKALVKKMRRTSAALIPESPVNV